MDYFITEKNVQVSKLYLTGGGCKFVGLSEAIAKQLDMPVEIWNPFNKITMGDGVDAAAVNENAQRLLVSTGLALYHYDTD
jgi:Tfp pilus assembly PilM family ATPase